MSYINYKSEENSIYVCKGHSKSFDKLTQEKNNENFTTLKKSDKFSGIKIKNFLSKREFDGLRGEEKFKALLENNNVPFLYIGQGPFGIERSGVLLEQANSKRADFIVNIPDMGTLLFDVKCRTKISFKKNGEKYFSIYVSELEALNNLQELILMPVWLAFYDREEINSDNANDKFYFIPISVIQKFYGKLYDNFENKKDFYDINVLRIPNELFTKIEDKMIFEVGYSKIADDLLKKFAKNNVGFNRKLKDRIKNIIREQECYKTYLSKIINEDSNEFIVPNEVTICIQKMIEDGIIIYKARQKLKLFGE